MFLKNFYCRKSWINSGNTSQNARTNPGLENIFGQPRAFGSMSDYVVLSVESRSFATLFKIRELFDSQLYCI